MATFKYVSNVLNHVLAGGREFITYDYGTRERTDYPEHHGVDLQCGKGGLSYIVAIADGVVYDVNKGCTHNYGKNTNCCNECGNYVSIKHSGGYKTRYMHMRPGSITLSVGDKVKRGAILGYMGTTGYSTGNHLHFDVRYNDVFVDPLPFLLGTSVINSMIPAVKDGCNRLTTAVKKLSKSINAESKLRSRDKVIILPGTTLLNGRTLDKSMSHAPVTVAGVKKDVVSIAVAGYTIGSVKRDRLLPYFDFLIMQATDALNVRDLPSTEFGNVIGVLRNKEYVILSKEPEIVCGGNKWRACFYNGVWAYVCSEYLTHE